MSFIHPVLGVNCSFETWSEHLDVTSDIVRGWMMCESSKSLSNFEINSINLVSFINLSFYQKYNSLHMKKIENEATLVRTLRDQEDLPVCCRQWHCSPCTRRVFAQWSENELEPSSWQEDRQHPGVVTDSWTSQIF